MEESTLNALYTGAYIFVFIVALTVTLYLFNSITKFADIAFAFNNEITDNATIVDTPVAANRLLDGSEVLSYYYNYVVKDQYGKEEKAAADDEIVYDVKIYNEGGNPIGISTKDNFNYAITKIGMNKKYILEYGDITFKDKKKTVAIDIKCATAAQIEAML